MQNEGLDPILLTTDGRESEIAFSTGGQCSDTAPDTIPPDDTRRFCLPYSVRKRAKLDRLQLTVEPLASLRGDKAIGVWKVRRDRRTYPLED